MPITEDRGWFFEFEVTKRLLELFDQNRIRTTETQKVHRWRPGSIVSAIHDAHLMAYAMSLSGDHINRLDAFSYSFAPLHLGFKVGRYCSIAWNVSVMGPQHPLGYTTSSEITYRPDGFFADLLPSDWKFLPNPQSAEVNVGNDVWIGQDTLFKGGVTIGTG